ncbi:DUF2270 domain-containing protein [Salinirubrum litoreum]|uniref:DUF2270 domain-containing protein n=1 Tax=Salinirubrum litoreum TaxID=1126234 RepID=A0ABD5R880_9EURY|nr:DUF2270 domain-containing protein [Salinirubrum litoreum]
MTDDSSSDADPPPDDAETVSADSDRPPRDADSRETVDPVNVAGDPEVGKGLLDETMGPSSAMAHLYRGEIHRMKFWRERLDRTTNWAVIVMAAVLTWAFSSPTNPHYVILVGAAALTVFLVVEARRYRGYDIWRSRVRSLQQNVWTPGLDPTRDPADPDWRRDLADDYDTPTIKITMEEAVAHRLRRIYLPLFAVLLSAWVIRITAFGVERWPESAGIGMISGALVSAVVAGYTLLLVGIALRPRTWHAREEMRTTDFRRER